MNLNMSNNFAVITQTQVESEVLPNPRLTMARPYYAPLLVPQLPEKKLIQRTLWGKVAVHPVPKHDLVLVQTHYHGSTKAHAHKRTITVKTHGNKKRERPNNLTLLKCRMTA